MTFAITLSDGSKIEGLELNGNNFISKTEISKDAFSGKLSKVRITGDPEKDGAGLIGEHTHMELVRCEYDKGLGGWAVVLRDIPATELERLQARGDIDYIAMMTGVEL